MCKIGDIILVQNCKLNDKEIGRHSFVVLNTQEGEIKGLSFDLVCNIMSSLEGKGDTYKTRKLSYPENMPYEPTEEHVVNGHGKEGFIKAGLFFLFNKEKTDYTVIGNIEIDLYLKLLEYTKQLDSEHIRYVKDNL